MPLRDQDGGSPRRPACWSCAPQRLDVRPVARARASISRRSRASSYDLPQTLDTKLIAGGMEAEVALRTDEMKLGFTGRDRGPAFTAVYALTRRDPNRQRRRYAQVAAGDSRA